MSSESKEPENSQPDAASKDAFMAKFKGVIESYANAISADDQEKADQAAMSALIMATMEAMEHPTPELELARQASEHLVAGNWQAAEDTYRKLIAMHEQTGKPGQATKPLMDLANLFYLRDLLEDAWGYAQAATESARRSEISTLLTMALDSQVSCSLAREKPEEALAAAEEALRIIDPGKMSDLMRSRAHANRGRALLGLGDPAGAEKDLEVAWAILRSKKPSRIGSGPVLAFARCFELEAELRARQKRFVEAVSLLKQAIEHRREGLERLMEQSPHPAAAVARDLERLAGIYRESGDPIAAEEALKEAAKLWEQIHLPERAKRRANSS